MSLNDDQGRMLLAVATGGGWHTTRRLPAAARMVREARRRPVLVGLQRLGYVERCADVGREWWRVTPAGLAALDAATRFVAPDATQEDQP